MFHFPLKTLSCASVISTSVLMCSMALASERPQVPTDLLSNLLDSNGGVAQGQNSQQGTFLVSLILSSKRNENACFNESKKHSLTQLAQYVKHKPADSFVQMFQGKNHLATLIKQGEYINQCFTAYTLTEKQVTGKVSSVQATQLGSLNNQESDNSNHLQTVESSGVASLKNGLEIARANALRNALSQAVQQVKGIMLTGRSSNLGSVLNSALSPQTEGYVQSYEILDEEQKHGNYHVLLVAEVDTKPIIKDIDFYLDVLNSPAFFVEADNKTDALWLRSYLEQLGFHFIEDKSKATHVFDVSSASQASKNHLNVNGMSTQVSISLTNLRDKTVIFTKLSDRKKSSIFIEPVAKAERLSKQMALKSVEKDLLKDVIAGLSKISKLGIQYPFEIKNASIDDWKLIKPILEQSGGGEVESFQWNAAKNLITFNYRYKGSLNRAIKEIYAPLTQSFASNSEGKKFNTLKIAKYHAVFKISNDGV